MPQERLSRAEEATMLQGEKRAETRPVGCFVLHRVFGGRPHHNPGYQTHDIARSRAFYPASWCLIAKHVFRPKES
jgi:hypothetical protein